MHLIPIPAGMETGYFVMGKNVLPELPELLRTAFPGRVIQFVADENTWRAAGARAAELLNAANIPMRDPVIFPAVPKPHPDYALSQKIAAELAPEVTPVAVGSGVLNDLVKCAVGIAKRPYACVATAASVDGYTSCGGAMTVEGQKKTVPCPAPYALLADTEILASAPPEMLASGYADLLTKVPAGADWRIADALGIEPVEPVAWQMVQRDLRAWVADPTNLYSIFMGLAATGYAMQLYRDSRPASGAEHLFSHVWEMEGLSVNGEAVSHGFKVGIGTLASIRLMGFVLDTAPEEARKLARPIPTLEARQAEITELLRRGCYGGGIPETALGKFQTGAAGEERRKLIFDRWGAIQRGIREQLLPEAEILRLLRAAGAPTEYAEIGLDRAQYLHGIRTAQLIRKRYTVIDLLYEAGLLETAIESRL